MTTKMKKPTKRPSGYARLFDPGIIKAVKDYAAASRNQMSFAFALRELLLKGLDASKGIR